MELVYLWVEKYKNIEKQGFNFSPKFRCEYDENTDELKIEEKEYTSIFPKNINITAIVGKNGSGKSSVLKAILMLIFYNKFREHEKVDEKSIANNEILYNNLDLKKFMLFLILKKENRFYKVPILAEKIENDSQIPDTLLLSGPLKIKYNKDIFYTQKIKSENIDFFTIYYNYTITTLKDGIGDDFIDLVYHRVDGYETPILIEPYKYKGLIDISHLEYLSSQKFANIFRLDIKNKFIEEFFNPNFIKIKINPNKIGNKIKKYESKLKVNFSDFYHYIINIPNNYSNKKKYEELNKIYIALKLLEKNYNENISTKLQNILFESKTIEQIINKIVKIIDIEMIEEIIRQLKVPEFEVQKILNAISFHKNILRDKNKLDIFSKNLDKKTEINDLKSILKYLPPWVDIEYFENDKSYYSLSNGEKMVFSFMINLMYQVNNAKDKYNTINLFLDETELTLHPDWQKKYIDYIIKTLEMFKNKIKINIVLVTHSPFIISDLQKENIIFLDKDENGKCKVVDGLNEKKETFGANIHTLLSDSFFMEDGFIGKFAESKINDVINYLNGKESEIKTDKEAQKIINIIGEPIIKKELQKRLDSKRLGKVSEIEEIKEEIELLKYRLEVLRKNS